MLKRKQIVLIFAILFNAKALKECPDCMFVKKCDAVANLALTSNSNYTIQILKSELCDIIEGEPKICCSQLEDGEVENRFSTDYTPPHANLRLLPTTCGSINGNRIIGGKTASLYEFPWMALLSYYTPNGLKFLCGGTIINERYVLTAAHCLVTDNIAGVRLGEYNKMTRIDVVDSETETYLEDTYVNETIIHPKYTKYPHVYYDIGLIRLQYSANFSKKNIAPICLPVTEKLRNYQIRGSDAVIAGWGVTENGSLSDVLLKAIVPVKTAVECKNLQDLYNSQNYNVEDDTTNKLCAGKENTDSCNGDSGGPLMAYTNYGSVERVVQYGIVSYGDKNCGTRKLGIYTEVTKYIDWILDNIKP